jgi:hypothetical protein
LQPTGEAPDPHPWLIPWRRPHPRASNLGLYLTLAASLTAGFEDREARDVAVSAAFEGREGPAHVLQELPPSPTAAVQEELLVNIKVKKIPLLALVSISLCPISHRSDIPK